GRRRPQQLPDARAHRVEHVDRFEIHHVAGHRHDQRRAADVPGHIRSALVGMLDDQAGMVHGANGRDDTANQRRRRCAATATPAATAPATAVVGTANRFARDSADRTRRRTRARAPESGITRPFRRTLITLPRISLAPAGPSPAALASPRSSKKRSLPLTITLTTRCASTRRRRRNNTISPRTMASGDAGATVTVSPSRIVGYMLSPSARN